MTLTLLIGGARSGKSSLAVDIGHRHHAADPVTYIATAPATSTTTWTSGSTDIDGSALDLDDDRGAGRPRRACSPPSSDGLAIVDCLTLWTSNLMWRELDDDEIRSRARPLPRAAASDRAEPTVVITNEVGLGVHPETELGRRYRDLLGWVNQAWADAVRPGAAARRRPGDPTSTIPWSHLP